MKCIFSKRPSVPPHATRRGVSVALTRLVAFIALVATVEAPFNLAAAPGPRSQMLDTTFGVPDFFQWGERSGEFQMAVQFDDSSMFLHAWIRNGSAEPTTYNTCFLGHWSAVGVEVLRENGGWESLPRDFSHPKENANAWLFLRVCIGMGPRKSEDRRLLPLETIYDGGWIGDMARGRRRPGIATTNYVYGASATPGVIPLLTTNKTPLIFYTGATWRPDIPQPPRRKSTLFVDLGDFEWPAHLLNSTTVNFRITQRLEWPENVRRVLVASPKIQVEGKLLRDFLEKLKSPAKPPEAADTGK